MSAGKCGSCHAKEVKQFDRSLHAAAVDLMKSDPKFARLSPAMADAGCNGCHQIGAKFADNSRGKCNSCHSGHSFSIAEAKRPESCAPCHSGSDHPQMEMWQSSKHGQLFAAGQTREQAPTCVTCHMPAGSHDTGIGLTLGNVANGAILEPAKPVVKMRTITANEAERQRRLMVQTCLPCHSSRFASESLAKADTIKMEADAVLGEAVAIITQLEKEGILQRKPLPAAAHGNQAEPAAKTGLVLGTDQVYDGLSAIEQRFFDMFKFHHAATFKGAYHHNPMYTHNEGFLRMKQDLTFIQDEAAQMRHKAKGR